MKIERFRLSHVAALLVGLLGGMGLTWSWAVRAEKRLVMQRDSLVAAARTLDSTLAQTRRDTLPIQEARTVIRWRAGRVDSLVDSLFVAAPDSLKPLVESLAEKLVTERRARDSLVSLLQSALAHRDTLLNQMQAQRDRALQLLDVAIRRNRRCGIGGSGPFSVNSHGAGWGVAFGLTCRL